MHPSLLLSLFPGADLLGRGFEKAGFCVVRGPDTLTGGDIRAFSPLPDLFGGVFGGSPCGDFSGARRSPPSGLGVELIAEFVRCVATARPAWFLHENVASVPDVIVAGYVTQRIHLTARECGGTQSRLRCFQFGSVDGVPLVIPRVAAKRGGVPCCLATEGASKKRRTWAEFCALQGLPAGFDLPGWSLEAKYRAVGNGVPVFMAERLAEAIRWRHVNARAGARPCGCGCGRPVDAPATMAGAACRKRVQRLRDRGRLPRGRGVTPPAGAAGPLGRVLLAADRRWPGFLT